MCAVPLQHHVQPLALDEIEQLERGTARTLGAGFPLLDGRQAGIQHHGEHGLTEAAGPPNYRHSAAFRPPFGMRLAHEVVSSAA